VLPGCFKELDDCIVTPGWPQGPQALQEGTVPPCLGGCQEGVWVGVALLVREDTQEGVVLVAGRHRQECRG
jgi:hypothetical protein